MRVGVARSAVVSDNALANGNCYCCLSINDRRQARRVVTRNYSDILEKRPLYVIAFASSEPVDSSYFPLVFEPEDGATVTIPHGLALDMAATLPALWFCLHLPGTFYQFLDQPLEFMEDANELSFGHYIWLGPVEIFEEQWFSFALENALPMVVICSDDVVVDVERRARILRLDVPVLTMSQLGDARLKLLWRAFHERFFPDLQYFGRELSLSKRLDHAASSLTYRWFVRQLADEVENVQPDEIIDRFLTAKLLSKSLRKLEELGHGRGQAATVLSNTMESERDRLRVHLTLGLPGVPQAYVKRAYRSSVRERIEPLTATDERDVWAANMIDGRSDALIERASIEFLVAHQSIARSGLGMMLSSVPQKAFEILAQLERHFVDNANGSTVWKLLRRLNAAASSIWTDELVEIVSRAKSITIYSNFPLGLVSVPGSTAPLLSRVPIAYRPLLPLARAIQTSVADAYGVNLASRLRILVLECISSEDPVGRSSRVGWKTGEEIVRESGENMSFTMVEVESIDSFRAAIRENSADILVVSAHGVFNVKSNYAGLRIGDDVALGPGLGRLPPVVVLSACHVAPRGAAVVSVADLLVREGAMAVLGTQVPVDVRHNAILMARFFVNIAETLAGKVEDLTLLDVWHRVQSNNPINDVLLGNRYLREWGFARRRGGSVLERFMLERSVGQVRAAFVYDDTERVLVEMAGEDGIEAQVRNWLHAPGYIPESMFYVFSGRPDRIYVHPKWIGVRRPD
jgi:hypothetical protein